MRLPPLIMLVMLALAACEAVPDIRFVDDGGATNDGGNPTPDGGADASACTTPMPSADALCCGAAWCVGTCTPTNCTECAQLTCPQGEVCCARPVNVSCKTVFN